MVQHETKNGIIRFYSDEGKMIRQKGSKFAFREAFEREGQEHEWEEVNDNE